jgi:hypothetical protein
MTLGLGIATLQPCLLFLFVLHVLQASTEPLPKRFKKDLYARLRELFREWAYPDSRIMAAVVLSTARHDSVKAFTQACGTTELLEQIKSVGLVPGRLAACWPPGCCLLAAWLLHAGRLAACWPPGCLLAAWLPAGRLAA